MPNHITNGVSIHHDDPKEIAKLKKKVIVEVEEENFQGEKTGNTFTRFDFDGVVPSPKNKEEGGCSGEHGEDVVCWYGWNLENWGTKWNSYEFDLKAEDDNNLHVQFDTAWGTPQPIWDKLEEMGFTLTGVWLDEGGGEGEIGDGADRFNLERTVEFY